MATSECSCSSEALYIHRHLNDCSDDQVIEIRKLDERLAILKDTL